MAIAREGKFREKRARTYRGKCYLCYEPVVSGQVYVEGVGGTNTMVGRLAHYNCWKPSGAPAL